MHRRRIVPVSVIAGLVLVAGPAGVVSDTLQQPFVGTWKLLSLYEEDEGGQDVLTCGRKPEGQLILDAAGGFSLRIGDFLSTSSFSEPANTAAAFVSARASMLGYRGKYSLDHDRIIHFHVERGLSPADPAAQVLLIGDRMELTSSSEQSPTGSSYSHMVWERLR